VVKELSGYGIRELWANPANGHPGDLVTDVYARYSMDYLLENIPDSDRFPDRQSSN
jgi:hypothetical protein